MVLTRISDVEFVIAAVIALVCGGWLGWWYGTTREKRER